MVRLLCVASLLGYASAGWTGALGLTFESNKPVEAKSLFCPSGFITGIRVKYGRTRDEDRDLYDFKLKCGQRWTSWSGLWFKNELEDKTYECPAKMYVTGIEVKRGRREWGDKDTYDFKLQCSGVWQDFMGMKFGGQQEQAGTECPSGEGTSGLKVFRGFVDWGDKDLYEFELNCKSIAANLASIRGLPDLKMLGLQRNVLVWDGEQLGAWLEALGLGDLAPSFLHHNVNGGTVFLLTEEHLRDLGFSVVGDRLYFIELLTQLYDDIVAWSSKIGVQLATHPVPPLRQIGLTLQPTTWSVKDVCKVLKAVGLEEYVELFVEHRIQGDVLFNLTEENLKEMGIEKIGDRLLITDIVQTLYEQVTGWQQQQVNPQSLLQLGAA
ncbi:hypothetical protein EMIHUDRAFT_431858 [Emiliania huxleyi CCMP1516]|uniref:SAM domain-containing protein n=2 Tax=Emiliania huxleyi TaxID=2903 RepID=A0A0D3L1K6_EMIH1|nr:hypothetical protein EMIHUDRAFT_431858 [Emiliania huxleyi CCMP1516]EOD41891.1 hypothetical protein EMIHUDRAFT_431858 [Emiliania huxleyi CCMP1516]|mmetsp:Transcript_1111/g.3383  ORF Transcript_1111/g.3383 Transcript_1111/m.3383 type:complete len:381 (-) Transcript_1111:239-1381(-)|eukprot:XP_005794320.1 hypothetical protein EMIHUDRAFT_431858 [Emiliania huxleyi CCMP1516]